ncbi:MAG: RNA-binding protein [Bacillales bacterium]|jgi:predicted RNA-binding protein YlxR (DUF448 family)|nr:RNA-binding protein [Bacillales bacterium]
MQKKVPMRKCVVTQEMMPKKELIRVVRSKEGEISVDTTGKKSGRGAYLSKNTDCVLQAQNKKTLDKQLDAKVPDTIYEELIRIIEREKLFNGKQ